MSRAMKDSGIAWIGEIPEEWSVSQVSFFFDIQLGKMLQPEQEHADDTYENYLCAANLGGGSLKLEPLKQMWFSIEDKKKFETRKGDLLVVEGGDVASCDIIRKDVQNLFIQNALHRVRGKNISNVEYLRYLLVIAKSTGHIDLICNKATIAHFTKEKFGALPFLVPSLPEQSRIVAYLDNRCAEIDRVISATQRTIEEYRKLKQSVITEAVTHGVRGERRMKDSGVEWIGEIPEEWECKPIKYVAAFQPTCDASYLNEDSEITYIPMECLKNGYYVANTGRYGALASSLTSFADGDIAMAKVTPCFENGNIAIMDGLCSGFGMGSSELFIYRAYNIQVQYLLYWLQNDSFKQAACATMTGTGGLKRVSPYFAKHSKIAVPDEEEQLQIISFLASRCAEIDRLTESKQQLLTQLEAYKKSVIYEYVTGKREV